ncbi:MAG: bifunctional glutamate N-acetyltransferase/amino-acid acetyltransferase ArgJ [Candidatus Hydrogenedentes bacterium]|nr:bifunctional glutamate N-acetyltransferase/amino-acid acetyltransferase ArgJ [Candidatus Hydrogenedentota bacterium]
MKKIEGGVCAPQGFQASGVNAKIKNLKITKKDCALVYSEAPATAAGAFTTNVVKAPPVAWTEGVAIRGACRAVFINSGNANACTGSRGLSDVQAIAEKLSGELGISITEVGVLSTGVIGVPLPMDRISDGLHGCVAALSPGGNADAAHAIMTTDTVPKEYAVEVALSSGPVRLGAMAKGSGMIAPNLATMIVVMTTDARIEAEVIQQLLRECVGVSFNCICVDNDMSTSDAVVVMANGLAGNTPLLPGTADYEAFAAAFRALCVEVAQALVRDGEGATKFVEIRVNGARTDEDAKTIARSIAHSQLCKTAFFGEDANWGRIACAAGYSGVRFPQERLCISLGDLEVVHEGLPTGFDEAAASTIMKAKDIFIDVSIGDGAGSAVFWTSDLSHDYVSINADYRT